LKNRKPSKKASIQPKRPAGKKSEAKNKIPAKEYLKKLLPLIKSFAFWFLMVIIVHLPGIREDFRTLFVGFTTGSSVVLGKILFLPIARTGFSTIVVNDFPMEIIVECTAYNFYLFAIALAVFANWSTLHKFINLGIFMATIFLVNNIRFFAMGYVGKLYPDLFSTTHDYVWNILFGFMIFGLWAWRDKVCNPDFKPKTSKGDQT
jgi:exosortase/archaeosortase family protein